ncbi:MAG TPA: class II glutamine amidotransferase [Gemmataceae bacterium]|nr:class II glutamine amidotransferase [Gemmataceae bacterium]
MCELMGLSFARPISADFSIHEFAGRGTENADGWGLAWYPDRAVAVVKEPVRWGQTPYTSFLESYPGLRSSLYIAHVRRQTTGSAPTYADTHPFTRELNGRDYCFAHNGTLRGRIGELPLGRYRPVGVTDSERAFCYLLETIAHQTEPLTAEEDWRSLHTELTELNELGQLNCLLSDGQRLFCYHDQAGYKGLTFRKISLRDGEARRFEDEELTIDLAEGTVNHGFVVATNPLSVHGWKRFHPGELLVLEKGIICFSSHRRRAEAGVIV